MERKTKYMAKKCVKNYRIKMRYYGGKKKNFMNKENYFKRSRIEYCRGNDLALLSASVVMAVCHDSRVFRTSLLCQ